jgi:hypothetical protein
MTREDEARIVAAMRAARAKARGYADFFGWSADRDLEELGVITALAESLRADRALFFSDLVRRGRSNDPPDCEAVDRDGDRIAIEVTELVDESAIRAFKAGRVYDRADWDREKFLLRLYSLIAGKDRRYPELKGSPYPGGYVVVVFTDEPMLTRTAVEGFLAGHAVPEPRYIDRTFLVLSYDPGVERCPYFELALHR